MVQPSKGELAAAFGNQLSRREPDVDVTVEVSQKLAPRQGRIGPLFVTRGMPDVDERADTQDSAQLRPCSVSTRAAGAMRV